MIINKLEKKIDNEKKIKKNRPESIQISTLNM